VCDLHCRHHEVLSNLSEITYSIQKNGCVVGQAQLCMPTQHESHINRSIKVQEYINQYKTKLWHATKLSTTMYSIESSTVISVLPDDFEKVGGNSCS